MKQIANIFMLAAVAAVALCSCSKAKNIDVSEDKVVFSIAGGEKSIDVKADGSYDIEGCPEWVTAEVGESVLTISVSENGTGAERDCVINLVGDNVSVPITITQADKCTHITVSETEVTIPKEGGRMELAIDTDGANIVMEASEGISAELKDGMLVINAPANEGGTINGDIVLSCDTVKTEVKVTLEGSICPKCNGTGKVKCTKCGGKGWSINDSGFAYTICACTSCGGSGYHSDVDQNFQRVANSSHPGYRRGSGQMTCPDCGGVGH